MKTETYLLPDFWACSLINGDDSGLEDSDIKALESWLESMPHLGPCLDVENESEGAFTRWHDASAFVLACNCLNYTFPVLEK